MHKTKMMRMRNKRRRFSQMTAQVSQGLQPNGQQQQMKFFIIRSVILCVRSHSAASHSATVTSHVVLPACLDAPQLLKPPEWR